MTKPTKKIESSAEAWEEGKLGLDENHVQSSGLTIGDLDETLELKLISIRLRKQLIEELKMIAEIEGMGYQPLIKQLLERFVVGQHKRYAAMFHAHKMKQQKVEEEAMNQKEDRKIA